MGDDITANELFCNSVGREHIPGPTIRTDDFPSQQLIASGELSILSGRISAAAPNSIFSWRSRQCYWERRKKLLAYAFLVWLLTQPGELVAANAQDGCHRTGQRSRLTASPLYWLHAAIAYLWTTCFPVPLALSPP